MMKKLMVLALVLAVAGLANAGLDLKGAIAGVDYTVDQVAKKVTITSTVGVIGFTMALQADNGPLSNVVVPAGFSSVNTPGGMDGAKWDGIGASSSAPLTGTILSFNYANASKVYFVYSDGDVLGAFNRSVLDLSSGSVGLSTDDSGIDGALYFMSIPEPMTMALLGLGGLFLRKRK